ncbi:hypothetical protein [Streptomyces sp. NPDC049949]|uniref:hypothetical protein n=1 Tax=Streptomyces sp. NPDC049949 TaxID=3154627 RepID=UPI00342EEF7C
MGATPDPAGAPAPALHRWDAESVTGEPDAFDSAFATDAVAQTFEVMVPARRGWKPAPAGRGERYRFRRTEGPESFDLTLFLWQRLPAKGLDVTGDGVLLEHWFTLVPPA